MNYCSNCGAILQADRPDCPICRRPTGAGRPGDRPPPPPPPPPGYLPPPPGASRPPPPPQVANPSGWAAYPAPGQQMGSPPQRRSVVPRVLVAVFVGLGLLMVGILVRPDGGPDHPDSWASNIEPLARFVESERGLEFENPIYVDFLDASEFSSEVTTDSSELASEDLAHLEDSAAYFRALGLASGDIDVLDEQNESNDRGILALYDPSTDRATVNAASGDDELSPYLRATIVHELTHALQDQYFDLERRAGFGTNARYTTFTAVVEGDAQRIEYAYVDQMGPEELAAYDEEYQADVVEAEGLQNDVMAAIVAYDIAPYSLGYSFVSYLEEFGGAGAVNDAIDVPPTSEEHLLRPWSYLDDDQPEKVVPGSDPDGEVLEEGDLGSLTWFLMFTERIDPQVALSAVDGWGGDYYRLVRRESGVCIEISVKGEGPSETDAFEAAVRDWATTMPNAPEVARVDDLIEVVSCDPGPDVDLAVDGTFVEAIYAPGNRAWWAIGAAYASGETDPARRDCIGRVAAGSLVYGELIDVDLLTREEASARAEAAAGLCP